MDAPQDAAREPPREPPREVVPLRRPKGDKEQNRSLIPLNTPRPAAVKADEQGRPQRVDRVQVSRVRDQWRITDRWWTEEPVERDYYELEMENGNVIQVFRDGTAGGWYRQWVP